MTVRRLASRRTGGHGVFGPVVRLSSDGRVVRAASSLAGSFSVIWQQNTAPWRIQARFGP
jgi:hypothetical protein